MGPIIILDALNFFLRSWSVVPTMNVNGEHVGGYTGFLSSLKVIVRDFSPSQIIVCWDGEGGSAKRRGIYAEYKAGRKPKLNREFDHDSVSESEDNMAMQLRKCKAYVSMLGIPQVEVKGIEADDIIGYLATAVYADKEKIIVSGDGDMLQLVNDKTKVWAPAYKLLFDEAKVKEKHGVPPCNVTLFRAIKGAADVSDNISGVKGIGPKKLLKVFPEIAEREVSLSDLVEACRKTKFKSLGEKILAQIDKIETNVNLMCLTQSTVSPESLRAIRYSLEKEIDSISISSLKIAFVKDGLQLKDVDIFDVFSRYAIMNRKERMQ